MSEPTDAPGPERTQRWKSAIGRAIRSDDPGDHSVAALRESEAQNRLLMNALADGVFVAQDYTFVYANLALPRMLGHEPEAFVNVPFEQVVAPASLPIWTERFTQRVSTSQPEPVKSYEVRFLKKDRREIELELVATRMFHRGRPAVLGLLRDITERKRVADELAGYRHRLEELVQERTRELVTANEGRVESENFAQTITDHIPGRIAYCDRELRCRFVNRVYCEWAGVQPEQVIGRTMQEVFGAQAFAELEPHVRAALAGQAQSFERQETRADGEPMTTRLHYTPDLRDGTVRGFFVLALDVTQTKQAERALQRLNGELVQARDKAQSAAQAKSAFIANVGHEILTPMNAIIGLSHLLDREPGAVATPERIRRVRDAAEHLLHIIGNVLDLQRIEAGALVLESAEFEVEALLAPLRSLVEEDARRKGLGLSFDVTALPRRLRGDVVRLSQALGNLLANAVKFTETGHVALAASLEAAPGAGLRICFEVTDTGIGIEPRRIEPLFSVFEQADASSTRRFGGLGLGLSITRQLARLMGGDAGATSRPGRGSTFWITVVLEAVDASPADADASPRGEGPSPAAWEQMLRERHGGARVLLAEDNPVNQDVGVALLTMAGLEVDVAPDGAKAVAMAKAAPYRAILMDVQMPELDGLEATRQLRAHEATRATPIIAMTTNTHADDRAACVEAGMNDYLAKPVDPVALYAALERWLSAPAGSPPAAKAAPSRSASPSVALDGIAGFDAARGLAFFAGNEPIFHGALRQFAALYGADGRAAREPLLAAGPAPWSRTEVERLRRELHSIGGACAAVGARAASEESTRIGAALRRSSAADAAQFAPVLLSLKAALAALSAELLGRLGDGSDPPPSA